ncbi:MAG: small subunit ribosomal protein S14 [Gammaproteobacteria bacterium]|nr:MAG: small subunit ribosomal protein S14 [Gammaproteobacteria bacterium]TND06594.1 MAG: small subunit ribosomal protein S14 [Gammaproteobacteria bacterium]
MAKTSMVNREVKRLRTVRKYATRRADLKEKLRSPNLPVEERDELRRKFQSLPRDAGPTRMRSRCRITGRSRGYYRKFGLGRNQLREAAMRGDCPGLVKASW